MSCKVAPEEKHKEKLKLFHFAILFINKIYIPIGNMLTRLTYLVILKEEILLLKNEK